MISVHHNIPSAAVVKRDLSKGYKERRNFAARILLRMLIGYTPVDTGEARGAWRVTSGGPATNHEGILDPSGELSYAAGAAALENIHPFAHVHIGNTAPHFPALEVGHSDQAPVGVIKVILPVFKAIMKDVD